MDPLMVVIAVLLAVVVVMAFLILRMRASRLSEEARWSEVQEATPSSQVAIPQKPQAVVPQAPRTHVVSPIASGQSALDYVREKGWEIGPAYKAWVGSRFNFNGRSYEIVRIYDPYGVGMGFTVRYALQPLDGGPFRTMLAEERFEPSMMTSQHAVYLITGEVPADQLDHGAVDFVGQEELTFCGVRHDRFERPGNMPGEYDYQCAYDDKEMQRFVTFYVRDRVPMVRMGVIVWPTVKVLAAFD